MSDETENTDREIWRGPDEGNGSYYADSIHVTQQDGIGINCGGHVIVMPLREWHRLARSSEDSATHIAVILQKFHCGTLSSSQATDALLALSRPPRDIETEHFHYDAATLANELVHSPSHCKCSDDEMAYPECNKFCVAQRDAILAALRAAAPLVPVDEPRPIDVDTISTLTKQVLWQQQEIEDLKHDLERYMEIASKEVAPSVPVEVRATPEGDAQAQIYALNLVAATEEADIDFILGSLLIGKGTDEERSIIRTFRKHLIALIASETYHAALPQPSAVQTVREALELAEDVLSRSPFSTAIWPNGMHPQIGIEKIRAALAASDSGKDNVAGDKSKPGSGVSPISTAHRATDKSKPPVEIRRNPDQSIDEICIDGGDVHIEQMDDSGWFMGVEAKDGSYWQFWFGAKNRKSHVEFRHTEMVPPAEQGGGE